MSENTKIEWCDHTFNPWEGCQKVSPGCDHCYAEARNVRFGGGNPVNFWPDAPRRRTSAANWSMPKRWNAQHQAFFNQHGRRQRVFCASLADVFDNAVPEQWRADLFELIEATPNLDWLLLTKRIGNAGDMIEDGRYHLWAEGMLGGDWPLPNVWIGATIVNQTEADRDIPKLLEVPAAKRFLSMEPLLGAVDIRKWLDPWTCSNCGHHGSDHESGPCRCDDCGVLTVYDKSNGTDECPVCKKTDEDEGVGESCPVCERASNWDRDYGFKFSSQGKQIDWVIVGGESDPHARPMHPEWALSIERQCKEAGVAFMFKQWGEWGTVYIKSDGTPVFRAFSCFQEWVNKARSWVNGGICLDRNGRELKNGGDFMRARDAGDFPVTIMHRVGKKASGRLLDGIEHNGFPE